MNNREIKFKAWDKRHKRWVSTEAAIWFDKGDIKLRNDHILMQYTGLKAKGKEIYEGDILKSVVDAGTFIRPVIFQDGHFGLKESESRPTEVFPLYAMMADRSEIIGNIYQNKELLE